MFKSQRLQWAHSSINDYLSIVESSSSTDKSVSEGDSKRAAELLLAPYQPPHPTPSIFPAQSFDSQTVCLMQAINQDNDALNSGSRRDVKVPKADKRSRDLHWNFPWNMQHFGIWISCHAPHTDILVVVLSATHRKYSQALTMTDVQMFSEQSILICWGSELLQVDCSNLWYQYWNKKKNIVLIYYMKKCK